MSEALAQAWRIIADSWPVSQWVGIATGLSVCRLSVVCTSILRWWSGDGLAPVNAVCNVRGLPPNGDRQTHDFFARLQGLHRCAPCTKQHQNQSSWFRAVADFLDPPYVPWCKHRFQPQNGARLLWNTIGKSMSDFKKSQKNVTLKRSFQDNECENRLYIVHGARQTYG